VANKTGRWIDISDSRFTVNGSGFGAICLFAMRETLLRFITIQPLNDHDIIPWAIALVWLALILNCLASLRQQAITARARLLWVVGIVCAPIIGMAVYLIYCLIKADYSFLKFFLGSPSRLDKQNSARLQLPSNTSPKSA
jgi:hypothetical protein